MKCFSVISICFLLLLGILFFVSDNLLLGIQSVTSKNISENERGLWQARVPPRGWNSYDSFCWTISEKEFLQSAEVISKHLHAHGYEYVVVDFLWYRRKVEGAYYDSLGFDVIDEWGRMIPDPQRWPSSKGGKGFKEVADKVHSMGLKFGIHVMRGISTQAVNANTPIIDPRKGVAYTESGKVWRAKDIAIPERACAWMPHGFMSVNTKLGAGRAFLRSLYEQYASWGVDYVKHDCVFGDDLDLNEISYVSKILRELDRPIVYSLSPGASVTPAMAKDVSGLVNLYRITGDDWNTWGDVEAHFNVTRDFSNANMIGARGLKGYSWPDLDMLPLGWLTDSGSNEGPHRYSRLNLEEQKTQMTLWAMAKSPLMYGGDVRKLDQMTYDLITNPTLLEINAFSSNNMEFPHITSLMNMKIQGQALAEQMRGTKRSMQTSNTHLIGFTGCTESKAVGWSTESLKEDVERICWTRSSGSKHQAPFCVHKREIRVALEESTNQEDYRRKHHLVAANTKQLCLEASPKRKLTSKELKRDSFSTCRWDANQMWELNPNGTLVNSYSSLCATVDFAKAKTHSLHGIRSWIAKGKQGEVYVAFFNLNEQKTVISAKASDLAKVIPGTYNACKCREVWSGKAINTRDGTLSAEVERHGCALLVLNCH